VANSSVKKLRDMVDPKHFCHQVTQPKMLSLLKTTFIERVGSSDVALRDRILSMDDGFEFLLKNRGSQESLEGVSKIFNLCTGRDFSPSYDTDPDFVNKLAQVRLSASRSARQRAHATCTSTVTRASTAIRRVFVGEVQGSGVLMRLYSFQGKSGLVRRV
jgi:hypothetical protein